MAVLPKSKKFGLQSKLDPRAVGPDIPIFLVCEILSVCDCPLGVNGTQFCIILWEGLFREPPP